MLSDPEKRKVYDQFGEEGLKGGFGGGGGGGAGFGGFHPRAAEEIFAEVRWAGLAEGCVTFDLDVHVCVAVGAIVCARRRRSLQRWGRWAWLGAV